LKDLGYPNNATGLMRDIHANFTTSYHGRYFSNTLPLVHISGGIVQAYTLTPYLSKIYS
jgi:hypothetical protein